MAGAAVDHQRIHQFTGWFDISGSLLRCRSSLDWCSCRCGAIGRRSFPRLSQRWLVGDRPGVSWWLQRSRVRQMLRRFSVGANAKVILTGTFLGNRRWIRWSLTRNQRDRDACCLVVSSASVGGKSKLHPVKGTVRARSMARIDAGRAAEGCPPCRACISTGISVIRYPRRPATSSASKVSPR